MGDSIDEPGVAVSTKIMVLAIVVLFLMMLFVVFLHLYAKWFLYRRQEEAAMASSGGARQRRRRRRRFDFAPGHAELSVSSRRGLDPAVLKSLPVVIFSSKDFADDGLECAVCLSDLADGEKARLLPKCNHGFHVDCIDMWFQSHSTCPLCRNPVSTQSSATSEPSILNSPIPENSPVGGSSTEALNFPTNVLFWGNETQVSTLGTCLEEDRQSSPSSSQSSSSSSSSSSSAAAASNNGPEGMLVIDIPRQIGEDEEPKSPVTTRLRSLKRLLSRERKVNPFSPPGVAPEQIGG